MSDSVNQGDLFAGWGAAHMVGGVVWREVDPSARDLTREVCRDCGNEWRACDCDGGDALDREAAESEATTGETWGEFVRRMKGA